MIPPGLFRLALASVVVVAHFSKLALGTVAVHLFFALSGYWIFRMYDGKYRTAALAGPLFIASRFMRLLPVFLLFNTAALLIHLAWNDSVAANLGGVNLLPNLLVLGYAGLDQHAMVPAWSLDLELQFYLLFPFLFAFLKPVPQRAWLLCPLLLLVGGWYMSVTLQDNSANVLPFGGFFLLGVAVAQNAWKPPARLVALATGAAVLLLAGVAAVPTLRGMAVHSVDPALFAWNTALNFVLAVLLAPLALSTVFRKSTRQDRVWGDLSYVVYCSHWIGVMLAERYLADTPRLAKAPLVVGTLAVTYAVSLGVLRYYDHPISRWRERWIDSYVRRPGKVPEASALP